MSIDVNNYIHYRMHSLEMPTLQVTKEGQRTLAATSMAHGEYLSSPAEQATLLILTQWPKQSIIKQQ